MKFGLSQIKEETPKIVTYIYKTLQFAAVLVGVFVMYLPIPLVLQAHIALGLLIGNKVISVFCNFFGIDDPSTVAKNTTVDKVTNTIEEVQNKIQELPEVLPPSEVKIIIGPLTKYGVI